MALREEFEKSGNWLFRHRSHLPFLMVPILLLALVNSDRLEKMFGERAETAWEIFSVLVSLAGYAVRCLTVGWVPEGTSGRNTKGQLAESLNVDGIYSVVRHPLYLGNFLLLLGIVLFVEVWWFVLICVLSFWLYYERIMYAEEAFLMHKFGTDYSFWASQTPAFWPRLSGWRAPKLKFSFRMMFKREYTTLMGLTVGYVALAFSKEIFTGRGLKFHFFWGVLLTAAFIFYFTLRYLRKKTKFFTIIR